MNIYRLKNISISDGSLTLLDFFLALIIFYSYIAFLQNEGNVLTAVYVWAFTIVIFPYMLEYFDRSEIVYIETLILMLASFLILYAFNIGNVRAEYEMLLITFKFLILIISWQIHTSMLVKLICKKVNKNNERYILGLIALTSFALLYR